MAHQADSMIPGQIVLPPVDETPGSVGHDAFIAAYEAGGSLPNWFAGPGDNDPGGPLGAWNTFSHVIFMIWNGGDVVAATSPADYSAESPETGTVIRITTRKSVTPDDVFAFSTKAHLGSTLSYSDDYINVWPNPYFGYNPEEKVYGGRRVLFVNLPESGNCTIRIFDIAGFMVRRIEHNNTGSNIAYWDLENNYRMPVANGLYLINVETESGNKILKLMISQSFKQRD